MSRATVIVLEESSSVREVLEQALREAGHRVLVTNDPREAYELACRVRVDLLVADGTSVDQRGPALLARLRELQPSLRLLCLTDGETVWPLVEGGQVLDVPFSLDELERAVAAALVE
jgi:DNA-binding NtrC family response regulator